MPQDAKTKAKVKAEKVIDQVTANAKSLITRAIDSGALDLEALEEKGSGAAGRIIAKACLNAGVENIMLDAECEAEVNNLNLFI